MVRYANIMISRASVLFLIAVFCDAQIKIDIKISSNKKYVNMTHFGYDNKVISDIDVKLFNITQYNLKRGIKTELGKSPDDVFLKDPTPNNNLFKKYHLAEVNRQLLVNKTRIVDLINEEVVLKTHEYINNSTDIMRIEKSLYDNVECTAFSSWSHYGYPNDEAFYNVNLNFKVNHLNYSNKWRDTAVKGAVIALGVTAKGTVNNDPGKTVISKLIANKIILLIEIEYVTKLMGNVIANYVQLYGKKHFWAPSLLDIMKAAKMKNEIVTKEWIEVRCYTDPKLEMYHKETQKEIKIYKPVKLIHKGEKNIL